MSQTEPLDPSTRRKVSALRSIIAHANCEQMKLIDARKLASLTKDNETSGFPEDAIVRMWQLGLLRADLVSSPTMLEVPGLVHCCSEAGEAHWYADERPPTLTDQGFADAFRRLPEHGAHTSLLFHPFRCYVLHLLSKALKCEISAHQSLLYSPGFQSLAEIHLEGLSNWWSEGHANTQIVLWNDLAALASVLEPPACVTISGRVTWSLYDDYASTMTKLRLVQVVAASGYPGSGWPRFRVANPSTDPGCTPGSARHLERSAQSLVVLGSLGTRGVHAHKSAHGAPKSAQ